jgi:hypothetical protein
VAAVAGAVSWKRYRENSESGLREEPADLW